MTFCNEHDGDNWQLCPCCGCGLSSTDYDVGRCTQCGRDLINDDEEWEDDALLQADRELIRSELSKD